VACHGEFHLKKCKKPLKKRLGRFLWLDKEASQGRGTLTEESIKILKRLKASREASDRPFNPLKNIFSGLTQTL